MEYVGWKSVQSAMRYVDAIDPFAQHKIEASLSASPATGALKIENKDDLA
ncbi:hypothetical protein [Undibacterium oligocarboniphilum]|nr:hypothetical protein [Undibacterium oligocarboniphilum]